MYKKLLLATAILLAIVISCATCFATNELQDAIDGVRNVVGGAENAVEDVARDASNASKDVTSNIENAGNSITNTMSDNDNNRNTVKDTNNDNRSTDYVATRTATDSTTFMGMGATAWTWLILGIATIAIIALIWYYSMQINSSNHDNRHG